MDLICRTCLACDDELEPLFCKKLVDADYMEITAMILDCTGLEMFEDDKLSNTICTQCVDSIIAAFKYRKKVWDSHAILLETTKVFDDVADNEIDVKNIITIKHVCESVEYNENDFDQSADENITELWLDDSKIDDLVLATAENHKSYRDMDKYIRFSDKSPTMRSYSCTICGQAYDLVGLLRKHLLTNHGVPVLPTFKCTTCSKTFVNELYYQRHLNEAHQSSEAINQNLVCDLCGKGFKFSSQLVEHVNRHNGVKPFKCKICEFRAVSSAELKVHMRSHTGEKPYVCHICGMGYKSSSHRGAHIKDAHSDGRPHKCVICAKSYKSRRVYMSHMQVHNPDRIIKCEICNKEFNYQKNLKVHMRQHGEKTFKCTECEKAFYQKQNCQIHMKKVHNVKM